MSLITAPVQFEVMACITCGCMFALTSDHVDELREKGTTFYCPNRHHMFYPKPKPPEDSPEKLKSEIERLKGETASLKTQVMQAKHDAEQAEARGTDEGAERAVATEGETGTGEPPARPKPICPHCGKRFKLFGTCYEKHLAGHAKESPTKTKTRDATTSIDRSSAQ